MTPHELTNELPKGLIKWYSFRRPARALCVSVGSDEDEALGEAMRDSGLEAVTVSAEEVTAAQAERGQYDYAIVATALERTADPAGMLRRVKELLRPDGVLLLAADNRMGIRYFCGDRDPYTGRNFDGVENYRRVSPLDEDRMEGRLRDRAELAEVLEQAGFATHRFYSVLPAIEEPQILVAEDADPTEELNIRIFPHYHTADTVFLEEENLYTPLIRNGLFHTMANGYLIECPLGGAFANARQVTVSMDRGHEHSLATIIRRDGRVEKKPLYPEGAAKTERMLENQTYLERHGIRMIDAVSESGALVMPFVQGMPLVAYFRSLMETDQEEFYRRMDAMWELILGSSEHVPYAEVDWEHFNPWWDAEKNEKRRNKTDRAKWRRVAEGSDQDREDLGVILRRGYIDLVLLNGFFADDDFVFYDQELYREELPAKAIMLRNIDFLYHGDTRKETILPRKRLLERYHIDRFEEIFRAHIDWFLNSLRHDDVLKEYHEIHRRDGELVHSNRQRMNFSAEEYQRIFVDLFKNTENKQLYLFGSGNFAEKFLAMYAEDYPVAGILDNNAARWGTELEQIRIQSPEVLRGLDASTYKVIICIKNYTGVLRQVREMGATNIGVYETNMEYARKRKTQAAQAAAPADTAPKKYHTGYIAGVFDLFHMGHLNLLRRAKEQCDYLIVGVVTDEGVRKNKQTQSFIPFEERLAIVQACRYVDEAVGIPLEFCDTRDAYRKFQFDVQFSGSDYADDPEWLEKQDFLREHGAELVFFPYTQSTSSTQLKGLIEQKLIR